MSGANRHGPNCRPGWIGASRLAAAPTTMVGIGQIGSAMPLSVARNRAAGKPARMLRQFNIFRAAGLPFRVESRATQGEKAVLEFWQRAPWRADIVPRPCRNARCGASSTAARVDRALASGEAEKQTTDSKNPPKAAGPA